MRRNTLRRAAPRRSVLPLWRGLSKEAADPQISCWSRTFFPTPKGDTLGANPKGRNGRKGEARSGDLLNVSKVAPRYFGDFRKGGALLVEIFRRRTSRDAWRRRPRAVLNSPRRAWTWLQSRSHAHRPMLRRPHHPNPVWSSTRTRARGNLQLRGQQRERLLGSSLLA